MTQKIIRGLTVGQVITIQNQNLNIAITFPGIDMRIVSIS